MTGRTLFSALITLILLVGACTLQIGETGTSTAAASSTVGTTTTTPADVVSTGSPPLAQDLYDVSELVKAVRNGVVSLTQERVRLDFFGVPEEVPAGAGTGIVVDDEGLILTNFHVIEGANRVLVTAADGRQREAEVVAEASNRDLALLRVSDSQGLEPLAFGSLELLEVGDPVVAIGNALGLDSTEPSVSAGIVSAKGRTIRTRFGTMQDLIQTDAAINPGNSGGPLLNAAGEVVGVNTAIAGNAQNIGFAISVETAARFVERFELGIGEPFLGVSLVDNSRAVAERLELGVDDGALVAEVSRGSPADEAGVIQWDVIVRIGDKRIEDSNQAVLAILETVPGDEVEIELVRGQERITLYVTIRERPPGT